MPPPVVVATTFPKASVERIELVIPEICRLEVVVVPTTERAVAGVEVPMPSL